MKMKIRKIKGLNLRKKIRDQIIKIKNKGIRSFTRKKKRDDNVEC